MDLSPLLPVPGLVEEKLSSNLLRSKSEFCLSFGIWLPESFKSVGEEIESDRIGSEEIFCSAGGGDEWVIGLEGTGTLTANLPNTIKTSLFQIAEPDKDISRIDLHGASF